MSLVHYLAPGSFLADSPGPKCEITWEDGHHARLSMPEIRSILGAGCIEAIKRKPFPAGHCQGRARGMWDANEREMYAAYRSLAKHLYFRTDEDE